MNKVEFIKRIEDKYGTGKYEVLGDYKNNKTKILIRCNTCGYEYEVNPGNFLNVCKIGCPKCSCKKTHDKQKLTLEDVVKRGKELYGDRYSYDKTDLNNRDKNGKVCFKCNKCGKYFWEKPSLFLNPKRRSKFNCPNCVKISKEENLKKKTSRPFRVHDTETFIKKLNEKYPGIYNTSKTVYKNHTTNLVLLLNGREIVTTPSSILGSKKPIMQNKVHDTNSFILKAKEVHGEKYDYDENTVYTGSHDKIIVKCKYHGYIEVTPANFLQGTGCRKCYEENRINPRKKSFNEFVAEAILKHNGKYSYDENTFVNYNSKMRIICPTHGEFWQKPCAHISGDGHGCPVCNESKLEKRVAKKLDELNIVYERWKKFDWLGKQSFDFYLPKYNIAIECQGKQHFIDGGWNGRSSLRTNIERDTIKKTVSEDKVVIFYLICDTISKDEIIGNLEFNSIYTINNTFNDIVMLFERIKNLF